VNDVTLTEAAGFPRWAARRAVWFVVAVHLPFVVFAPLTTITRRPGMPPGEMALIALLGAVAGGLQLRHSLAAARGQRTPGWPLTFAMLIVLADVPGVWLVFSGWHAWLTLDWIIDMQWFTVASTAMLLPRRLATAVVTIQVAVLAVLDGIHDHHIGFAYPQSVFFTCYYAALMVMGGLALFGSARLVGILGDLFAARTEIAEQALARERFRVSRDLHDLLGHSLSAVSLKGDLAIRLLPRDPPAAQREIESLTGLARTTLRDMRAVARGEHNVALAAEAESAQAVLGAAGISTSVAVELPSVPPAVDAVLAWAVREGATNVLRHSDATTCTVRAWRQDGLVQLEIVNDGAPPPSGSGSGLAGLAARASELGGTVAGTYAGPGEFRLRVAIPEAAS
jgi:two-component system, NarL family, sensor histidine kinase DesK